MNTEVARMKKAGRDDKSVPEFRECGVGETFPFECATILSNARRLAIFVLPSPRSGEKGRG